jgi:hypothetical protein
MKTFKRFITENSNIIKYANHAKKQIEHHWREADKLKDKPEFADYHKKHLEAAQHYDNAFHHFSAGREKEGRESLEKVASLFK